MAFLDTLFGGKKEEKFLGVDIGSSSIKIVQLSTKKGTARLDTFGEIALGPYAGKEIGDTVVLTPEKYAEALRDLLKESQADAMNAGLAIPLKSSLVFNLKLPEVKNREKMDSVVRIEARRYIPVPISEVTLDWSIMPRLRSADDDYEDDDDRVDVLVVAIHKETLNNFKTVSDNSNLALKFMEIETFSTIRSIIKHEKNSVLILDIGSAATKVYIVEQGLIQKSHIINVGSRNIMKVLGIQKSKASIGSSLDLTNKDLSLSGSMKQTKTTPVDLARIIKEVNRVILDYQKKNRRNIEKIVMTGGGSILKGIYPYLAEALEAEIEFADPFSKVETPAFLADALRDAGPEFSVAIGLAIRGISR